MVIPLRDNAPSYDTPYVTLGLILVNGAVFCLQLVYPGGIQAFIDVWGEVPARIWAGETVPGTSVPAWTTLFTSMFIHFGALHLGGNMLMLWLFGDNIEWVCGRLRFLLFYLASGLIASLVTTGIGATSEMAGAGASGAVAGVMAAYLLFYPRARITSLMWISPFGMWHWATGTWGIVYRNISALWFIGSWVLFEVLFGGIALAAEAYGNFGVYAHVGGALAGAALIWPLHIASRRPAVDHHTQTAELSAAIIGDEGDGGDGFESLTPEEELLRWNYSPQGRLERRIARLRGSFSDQHAEELLERGELREAQQHCQDMLELALQQQNEFRVEGYRAMLDEIDERQREQSPARSTWG